MAGLPQWWHRIRDHRAWGYGALVSAILVLPLFRVAARHDKTVVYSPGAVGVHEHPGLFLDYGLFALIPALIAAIVGRKLRWVNIAAVIVVALLAIVCEFYVSQASTWTF